MFWFTIKPLFRHTSCKYGTSKQVKLVLGTFFLFILYREFVKFLNYSLSQILSLKYVTVHLCTLFTTRACHPFYTISHSVQSHVLLKLSVPGEKIKIMDEIKGQVSSICFAARKPKTLKSIKK